MSTKKIMNICREYLEIELYYLISKNAFKIHENNCFLATTKDIFQAVTTVIGPNLSIGHSVFLSISKNCEGIFFVQTLTGSNCEPRNYTRI